MAVELFAPLATLPPPFPKFVTSFIEHTPTLTLLFARINLAACTSFFPVWLRETSLNTFQLSMLHACFCVLMPVQLKCEANLFLQVLLNHELKYFILL